MSLYRFTHQAPDDIDQELARLLLVAWPWHVLLAAPRGHLRIQAREDVTGARYWPATGTIVVSAVSARRVYLFTHELGHAFDQIALTDSHRDQVREAMGVEGTRWTINRDLKHHEVTGESFAEWFAYEAGQTTRDRWGEHRWDTQAVRDRLKEIVMAAGSQTRVFDDVPPGSTHADGIHWAAARELISGYGDGTFGPYEPVSRGQLASILKTYDESR